jgi:tetrapyrrole methylase family protein/MazG family protein
MNEKENISHLFDRLVGLSARLRGPKGCPWDKAQTHKSLKADLIEEAYEVAEAIDEKDNCKLIEELGDLLYQVIFHARIAEEKDAFTLHDVLAVVYEKMLRRHPHVFETKKTKSQKELLRHWQEIKLSERKRKNHSGLMKDFSRSLPALLRARAVQERAKRVGFDWPDKNACFKKLTEEMKECKTVFRNKRKNAIKDETGDILFTLVNLSRFLDLNPEEILHHATDKFIKRFEAMEKEIKKKGKNLSGLTLEEMDCIWEKIKKNIT